MPGPLHHGDNEEVLEAERDIQRVLGDRPLDFEAMLAISNIYRAAGAVRSRMERDVLTPVGLTWGGFTVLFVVWVWGDRETGILAKDCGVAKGTLTGLLTTLERGELVERNRHPEDGRRVVVSLTPKGRDKIESVFPDFNRHETLLTAELEDGERVELARLLRMVTSTATGAELVDPTA